MLLDDVRDLLDRLYKVSTKIRNPSTRLGLSKALRHKEIDRETDVDLLRAMEPFDRDYIRSLFLQYQRDKVLLEHPTVELSLGDRGNKGCEGDDQIRDPICAIISSQGQDSYLVLRLARANTRRRQQFAYWKMHREKLIQHTRASVSLSGIPSSGEESALQSQSHQLRRSEGPDNTSGLISTPVPPSVTTATHLSVLRIEASAEQQSTISVSEYAPSAWQPVRDLVAFPPPPTDKIGDNFFECPYCMTFCPLRTLRDKAWK